MRRPLLLAPLALLAAACSGVTGLSSPGKPLGGDEPAAVRRKADAALAEKRFADAWDLEAAAGRDRARLEAIALASLEADKGPYEDMIAELLATYGGLTPAGRARVDALATTAEVAKDWDRAVEVQLLAAEDAPEYRAAWGVYERTPPKDALDVLEAIQEAREDRAADAAAKAPK